MVRLTIVCWCVITITATCWGQAQPGESPATTPAEKLLRAGYQALAKRDFLRAQDYFGLVLELEPNHSRASRFYNACTDSLAVRAQELVNAGDRRFAREAFAEALINYHAATRLDSTRQDIFSRIRLAGRRVYSRNYMLDALEAYLQNNLPKAEEFLDSAAQFDADYRLIPQFQQLLQSVPAESVAGPTLRNDPELWETHLTALQHFRDGDFSQAIAVWEKVLERYPNDQEIRASIRQAILRWETSLPVIEDPDNR